MSTDIHNLQTIQSTGKILLFGEHIVFCGADALGLPIHFRGQVSFEQTSDNKFSIQSFSTQDNVITITDSFLQHFVNTCKFFNLIIPQKDIHGKIIIHSEVPLNIGFGSSSVFCSCLAKIMYQLSFPEENIVEEKHLTKICHIAHALETYFHRTTSGIDTALCTYQKALLLLNNGNNNNTFHLPLCNAMTLSWKKIFPYKIVYACTTRNKNCAHTIAQVQTALKENPVLKETLLTHNREAISIFKAHMTQPIPENVFTKLAQTANEIHTILKELQISTSTTDKLIEQALSLGAAGGKLSGGGAGGAFVLFCKTDEKAQQVLSYIKQDPEVLYANVL